MKSSPKLQETLEVFFDKFEELEHTLEKTQKIIPELDNRIQKINDSEIPVNTIDLKLLIQEYQNSNQNNQEKLEKIAEIHEKKISKASQKAHFLHYYFYIALLLSFLITVLSIYYAISTRNGMQILETKNESYARQIYKRNKFLNEKELIEEFIEWSKKNDYQDIQ